MSTCGSPTCDICNMPDVTRSPTDLDRTIAGLLSTVWPLSLRHPEEALHLAQFIQDSPELGALLKDAW